MNKELLNKAEALNKWILDQEVVKEYKKYADEMNNHPEYLQQEAHLKELQKLIIQTKDKGEDTSSIEKEYYDLKTSFLSNPLINNYLVLKEEVNDLLQNINTMINQHIQE